MLKFKRSSDADPDSQSPMETRSKRVKVDETDANSQDASGEVNNPMADLIHDPKYYFEDGNVTFRVRNILFKLHTSIFKAHSEDFFNQLDLPPSAGNSKAPGGSSDEDAIVISDIQPSQFRNLIKIVYCLQVLFHSYYGPSNDVVFGQLAPSDNKLAGEFECYLDVAILSRKFGMEATQNWAKTKLKRLMYKAGKDLVDKIDQFYKNITTGDNDDSRPGDNLSRSQEGVDDKVLETSYEAQRLVEVIRYSKAVSDIPLLHGTLSILEYYLTNLDLSVEFLVSFFRIADLRETSPSLFGFIFLLLLSRGNKAWVEKIFTRDDRMALFSAQSFLTPLPNSVKESSLTPLFEKPTNSRTFIPILSGDGDNGGCESRCHKNIFAQWESAFTDGYYKTVRSKEFSILIEALLTLPSCRLDFVVGLREIKCRRCRSKILDQLDNDIQEVFSQVAEYYKEYH